MAKLSYTKSAMKKERDGLALFEKVLPSLDLKRMQLTIEFKKAQSRLADERMHVEALEDKIANQLPMLANRDIPLKGLVRVKDVRTEEDNVVGVRLVKLLDIEFEVAQYSMLAKPHWVDVLVDRLKEMARARLTVQIARERVKRLDYAVRRITQRVNLFEKILIPTAKKNIKRIQIFLGDADRSAIVRSKIAKAMRAEKRKAFFAEEGS